MNKRQKMIEQYFAEIKITEDDGTEKDAFAFRDNWGYLLDRDSAVDIIHKLLLFYSRDDASDWIEQENEKQALENKFFHYTFKFDDEKELYLLNESTFEKRSVNKNKSNWGFTCKWCGSKWRSKESDDYYNGYFTPDSGYGDSELACSEACAKHISMDLQKEWINRKGYEKYFVL